MPLLHKSRAFVLDSADYRETSRLLHVFCEHEGRISLIAKGLRGPKSKMATAAEPFNLLQISYRLKEGESLGLLTGVEVEQAYGAVRTRLEAYALANYWMEIVGVAAQARLASPELFKLTEDFLETLEQAKELTAELPWYFSRLLQELGFGAQLDECAACGRADLLEYFDARRGAAICSRCGGAGHRYLPLVVEGASRRESLIPLFSLSTPSSAEVDVAQLKAYFRLLHELLVLHLDRTFKSYAFVMQVLR